MDAVPLFFGVLRAAELAVQKWGLDVWVDLAKGSMVNLSACDRCCSAFSGPAKAIHEARLHCVVSPYMNRRQACRQERITGATVEDVGNQRRCWWSHVLLSCQIKMETDSMRRRVLSPRELCCARRGQTGRCLP